MSTELLLRYLYLLLPVGIILVLSEYLRRKNIIEGEYSRKLVHVVAGAYICYWPWLASMNEIALTAVALIVSITVSHSIGIFHAIHDVRKRSLGDLLYPVSILLCALLTDSPRVFAASLAYMMLADGLAAVIGTKYGQASHYSVMGNQKSKQGTVAYLLIASAISLGFLYVSRIDIFSNFGFMTLVSLPLVTAALEHISPAGTDNLTIPLTALFFFQMITYLQ
jgi:phytol kinase